jgi:hypothetical protein
MNLGFVHGKSEERYANTEECIFLLYSSQGYQKVNHSTLHLILKVTIVSKTEEKNIQTCKKAQISRKKQTTKSAPLDNLPPCASEATCIERLYTIAGFLTDMTIT